MSPFFLLSPFLSFFTNSQKLRTNGGLIFVNIQKEIYNFTIQISVSFNHLFHSTVKSPKYICNEQQYGHISLVHSANY